MGKAHFWDSNLGERGPILTPNEKTEHCSLSEVARIRNLLFDLNFLPTKLIKSSNWYLMPLSKRKKPMQINPLPSIPITDSASTCLGTKSEELINVLVWALYADTSSCSLNSNRGYCLKMASLGLATDMDKRKGEVITRSRTSKGWMMENWPECNMLGAVVNAPHNIRVGSTKIKYTQGLLTCQQFLGSNWDHPSEVHRTEDASTQISPLAFLPLRSSGKMAKVKVKFQLLRTKDPSLQ